MQTESLRRLEYRVNTLPNDTDKPSVHALHGLFLASVENLQES